LTAVADIVKPSADPVGAEFVRYLSIREQVKAGTLKIDFQLLVAQY